MVDPETGRRLPDGERGALAVTHIDRRGTVLLRFLVGDVVSLERGPCPHCGRSGDRIVGPVVRSKDLVKVKGMLLNPAVLLQLLQAVPAVKEFQLVLQRERADDPFSMDEMLLRVATDLPPSQQPALAQSLAEQVRAAVRVSPRVVFEPAEAISDARQTKVQRFLDRR